MKKEKGFSVNLIGSKLVFIAFANYGFAVFYKPYLRQIALLVGPFALIFSW
jgi:hypothetical protein